MIRPDMREPYGRKEAATMTTLTTGFAGYDYWRDTAKRYEVIASQPGKPRPLRGSGHFRVSGPLNLAQHQCETL